jgi:hypothetical protein
VFLVSPSALECWDLRFESCSLRGYIFTRSHIIVWNLNISSFRNAYAIIMALKHFGKAEKGEHNIKTSLKQLKDWKVHKFCPVSYYRWSFIYQYWKFGLYYYSSQDTFPHLRILIACLNDAQETLTTNSPKFESDCNSRKKKCKFILLSAMKSSGLFLYAAGSNGGRSATSQSLYPYNAISSIEETPRSMCV